MNYSYKGVKISLVILILYSLLYAIYTFPTVFHFSTSLIGKNDAYVYLWNIYILKTGLATGKVWTTTQSFYPWGTSLLYHGSTPVLGIIALFFQSKIFIINLFIYAMFIMSAIGAYWLSKQFITNSLFAFICGFIFAFSPYKMARIEEHYNLVFDALIPIVIFLLFKAFSYQTLKVKSKKIFFYLILSSLICFIIDYSIFSQMVYLSMLLILYFIFEKVFIASNKRLFWIIVVSFFIVCHFLIKWFIHLGIDDKGGLWWGGNWINFIVPYNSLFHIHQKIKVMFISYFNIQNQQIESNMFLGYSLIIALIISFVYLIKYQKIDSKIKALFFSFFMLVMIVMPVFKVPFLGSFYPPTAILHFLPIIKNFRCPTRFVNDIMLISPIIVFYGLEKLKISSKLKIGVAFFFFVMLFVEYYPKNYVRINEKSIPKVFYTLEQKKGESVLVYPLGLRDGMNIEGRFDIENMQYQTIYKKKTMGGYISRLDGWIWYVHFQNPFTNSLIQLEKDSLYKIPDSNFVSAIKSLKLDFVVIPGKYKKEKAALFLDSIVQPLCIKKEVINGDLLLSLKRN